MSKKRAADIYMTKNIYINGTKTWDATQTVISNAKLLETLLFIHSTNGPKPTLLER